LAWCNPPEATREKMPGTFCPAGVLGQAEAFWKQRC
jgi:hypothetical protein